jgi:hypothetical protein
VIECHGIHTDEYSDMYLSLGTCNSVPAREYELYYSDLCHPNTSTSMFA